MQQYRCAGSATEDFEDSRGVWHQWRAPGTARCKRCGHRVGLYPYGSRVVREMGYPPVGWRLRTHYTHLSNEAA